MQCKGDCDSWTSALCKPQIRNIVVTREEKEQSVGSSFEQDPKNDLKMTSKICDHPPYNFWKNDRKKIFHTENKNYFPGNRSKSGVKIAAFQVFRFSITYVLTFLVEPWARGKKVVSSKQVRPKNGSKVRPQNLAIWVLKTSFRPKLLFSCYFQATFCLPKLWPLPPNLHPMPPNSIKCCRNIVNCCSRCACLFFVAFVYADPDGTTKQLLSFGKRSHVVCDQLAEG